MNLKKEMKIALVSAYMLESVMPLAKYLAEEDVDVHLYAIMPKYNQNLFVVDFTNNKQPSGFIASNILAKQMNPDLFNYLSKVKTNFFVFPAGSGKKSYFSDIYYAWKLCQRLIIGNFDIIHLVHSCNRFSLLLMHFLRDQHLIQTLHEVTGHSGETGLYSIRIFKKLIKNNIPIIFHSYISKERFISFRKSVTQLEYDKKLFSVIRFGLYETYTHYLPKLKKKLGQQVSTTPIILHFGRIVPYKGIDILIDAVKIIQKKQKVHLIIAGAGKPYFSFEGVDSYEYINHSLSNEEIVTLIENCEMVVCPYKSASQSGIPVTVFAFNKPIVASDTGGFKEMIDHEITGLLVKDINAASFAAAIENLITNETLRKRMPMEIEQKFKNGEFSWTHIAKETIKFYQKHFRLI